MFISLSSLHQTDHPADTRSLSTENPPGKSVDCPLSPEGEEAGRGQGPPPTQSPRLEGCPRSMNSPHLWQLS